MFFRGGGGEERIFKVKALGTAKTKVVLGLECCTVVFPYYFVFIKFDHNLGVYN